MNEILSVVRRSYQDQVDQVVAKWKVMLDRAHRDVEKYKNMYRSERAHTRKLQTMSDQLRGKLLKYKGKDTENQVLSLYILYSNTLRVDSSVLPF